MRGWVVVGVLVGFAFGCGDSGGEGGGGSSGTTTSSTGGGGEGQGTTSGVGGAIVGGACTPVNPEPEGAEPGPILSDAALSELFVALDDFAGTRPHGEDAESDAKILYELVRTAPHVADAGIGQDCAVWMRLTDGMPVSIFKDRQGFEPGDPDPVAELEGPEAPPSVTPSPPDDRTPRGASSSYALPKSAKAFVGQSDKLGVYSVPRVKQYLDARGYVTEKSDSVRVSDLKNKVKDLGVLFLSTHGLTCADWGGMHVGYCLTTDASFEAASGDDPNWRCNDTESECSVVRDLRTLGRIGLSAQEINGKLKGSFAINHAFVSAYWTFSENALVFLDACESMAEAVVTSPRFRYAPFMRGVLLEKQVGAILGWSGLVGKTFSAETASLAFDKILGTNELEVPTPKQRPFSTGEVYAWLGSKNKLLDPNNPGTSLKLQQAAGADVILAPSARNVVIGDPSDTGVSPEQPGASTKLTIYGEFGTQPAKVKIGGSEVSVDEQTDSKLVVRLPGPTSDGLVGVEVPMGAQTLVGNEVPLTSWRGTCRFKTINSMTFGPPGIFNELDCSAIHLRSDIHRFRTRPGDEAKPGYATDGTSVDPILPFRSSVADTVCEGKTGGTSNNVYQIIYTPSTITLPWLPNEMSSIPGPPTSYYILTGKMDTTVPSALKIALWPANRLHADADFVYPPPAATIHVDDFGTTVAGLGFIDHFMTMSADFSFQQPLVNIPIGTGDQAEMQCTMSASQIPTDDIEG